MGIRSPGASRRQAFAARMVPAGICSVTRTPCRQAHQQQKQRPHDDGSQTPDLKTVREAGDSRGFPLHGRSASCAAHLLVTRHLPLLGVALSRVTRLVARRLRVRPSKRGGSSQQQKQRVSPPVQTPRQCCLGGALSLRSARGGVVKQSWTTCEKGSYIIGVFGISKMIK